MGSFDDNYGDQMRKAEQHREGQIRIGQKQIANRFAGFDPAFYANRALQYQQYAMPQVGEQYRQQRAYVAGNLANRGLTRSATAQRMFGSLGEEMGRQSRAVIDEGLRQSQQLQQEVENQRAQITAQLNASADPATATQQAIAAASGFTAPSVFTPIANSFANWANTYMQGMYGGATNTATPLYQQAATYVAPQAPTKTTGK